MPLPLPLTRATAGALCASDLWLAERFALLLGRLLRIVIWPLHLMPISHSEIGAIAVQVIVIAET